MCTTDNRILKPKEGETISINASKLSDQDCITVNKFIEFARQHVELTKLIIK